MAASVVVRRRLASGGALVLCWLLGFGVRAARADANQDLYESQHAERARELAGLAVEPSPERKRIAFIEVARDEVFLGDELLVPLVLPRAHTTWPNAFHWRTRESVVRRELLLSVGDRFDAKRVEESMRNLRALGIFSLVRVTAVRADDPDGVGLFVYTRDLWSLRFETPFAGTGQAFTLGAQLIERNLFGLNKQFAGRFLLDPKSYSLGEEYEDARVLGGDLLLDQTFDVIVNREQGGVEGTTGSLDLERPFRRLSDVWSWALSGRYADYVKRQLQGSEVASYRPGTLTQCLTPEPECLRSVWHQRNYLAGLSGSYRRGERYKQTFTLGLGASGNDAHANAETQLSPGQADDFSALLPKSRRQIYPWLGYDLWVPDYYVFQNLSTFGRSESVRAGPSLTSRIAFPLRGFGSSTDSVTFSSGLGYVLADGKALGEIASSGSARLEQGRVVDQQATLVMRGATPPWLLGRMVGYASATARRYDTSRTQAVLGGDNGLRGYESGAFSALGGSRLRGNIEYRSLPVVFESIHIGGVLFYDIGSVYTRFAYAELHHSIGAGLRVLFPQFNPTPFRADVGLPLDRKGFSILFSYSSEQAVPLTAADDLALTTLAPR